MAAQAAAFSGAMTAYARPCCCPIPSPFHRTCPGASSPRETAASSMAPVYTLASRSTVADQPKADACRSAPADSARSRPRRPDQAPDGAGPVGGVVAVHQDAGVAVPDDRAQPADAGRHHGGAAGLRLKGDKAERLRVRRGEHQRRRPVPLRELVLRARRLEPDGVGDAELGGKLAHPVRVGAFLPPARAADDDHLEGAAQARVGLEQPGRGLEHDVRSLERLHPADEEQHHRVRRDPEPAPRLRPALRAARPEDAQVRARVDGLHLGRVRAVQRRSAGAPPRPCWRSAGPPRPPPRARRGSARRARRRRPPRAPRSSPCPGCASTARAERPSAPWRPRRPCRTASSARAPGRTCPARTRPRRAAPQG